MKDRADAVLQPEQAAYLESILPRRDPLLSRVEEYAREHRHPIADPEVALTMSILIRARRPRRLLEIGTNIGYSVIVMGRSAADDAEIETIEIDRDIVETAKRFVGEASLRQTIRFHEGAALDVIPRLEGPYDFVFIDCVKTEYEDYLLGILPLLSRDAIIVADNVLWKGQVAKGPRDASQESSTAALRDFNRTIMNHPALLSIILPIGDGLALAVHQPAES